MSWHLVMLIITTVILLTACLLVGCYLYSPESPCQPLPSDTAQHSTISKPNRPRTQSMSKLRLLSKLFSKTVNALLLLFPLMLSVSCADTRPELIPAPVIPLPLQLTAGCDQAEIPDDLTFGGAVELLADAMKYIANYNHDKRAIREIEQQRASGADY